MSDPRVIGTDAIEDARRRGRLIVEVMPGDIVTALARETAERLGRRLVDGPVETPAPPRTGGQVALRRGLYRRSAKWVAPARGARPARRLGPNG